ncbi:DUF7446 family protein [Caballeronia sp. KNU42]
MSGVKLDVWMSEITHRIYIGHCREVPNGIVSYEKKDVTAQCINGAAAHLVAIGETDVIVSLDNGKYRIQITKAEPLLPVPKLAARRTTAEETQYDDGTTGHRRRTSEQWP